MEPARAAGGGLPGGRTLLVALLLLAAVAAVYGRTFSYPFLYLDDRSHLQENRELARGFTPEAVRWALTTTLDTGWIPVTWLSRLADAALLGPDGGMQRLVNALFHACNAFLLFLFLRGATGREGEAAFASLLFAVHPFQVGTVAWVIERKEILASFFSLLSILAWRRYALRPGIGPYAASLGCFLLSLLSKPSSVPLPFLLLLLDLWPLGRLRLPGREGATGPGREPAGPPPPPPVPLQRLLLEKVPFLALSAAASAVAFLDERAAGAVTTTATLPLRFRAGNAFLSYATYLAKAVAPLRIPFFYPHPAEGLSWPQAGASALLVAAVTAACAARLRKSPWLFVGWCWFLGMLVPAIGLVQAGAQGMGNQYVYFPLAGLCLVAARGGSEAAGRLRLPPAAATGIAAAAVALLAALAFRQGGYWRDSETLFRHSASVTGGNWFVNDTLGYLAAEGGRDEEAVRLFRSVLAERPEMARTRGALASSLARLGRGAEAEGEYREAIRLDPGLAEPRNNFSVLLMQGGRWEEAALQLREAIRLDPRYPEARWNLALALSELGDPAGAERELRAALSVLPESPEAHNNLGTLLARRGELAGAEREFAEALRLRPGYGAAAENLARARAEMGRRGAAKDPPADPIR